MRSGIILLLAASVALAYNRSTTEAGTPLWRRDAADIRFQIHASIRAGASSSDGGISITSDSDPVAALSAAAATWGAVPDSTVRFGAFQETTQFNTPRDGQHVIQIVDDAETRSVLANCLAVTVWSYNVADGSITDTDILFNPRVMDGGRQIPFSTTRESGTFDFQSVATHEFGHALGAGHSPVISSAMFQTTNAFSRFVSVAEATVQSNLASDDIAFLVTAYPADGVDTKFGRISGTVRFDSGNGVRGPLVIAVDSSTGVVVGSVGSMSNGAYSISGLPRGNYHVYAQPLDGPVLPGTIGLPGSSQAELFRTTFAGGNQQPAVTTVEPGIAQTVDISVDPTVPGMHVNQLGVGSAGGMDWSYAETRAIVTGRSWDILLWGKGLDTTLLPEQILLLGPGITLREGSLRMQSSAAVNGVTPLRFTVDVAPRNSYARVAIAAVRGTDAGANSASLLLLPDGSALATHADNIRSAALPGAIE